MKKPRCDKGLGTSMIFWLRHLQSVTKMISITHMLLFVYLQTRIFNQQGKQHRRIGKKITFYTKILHFRSLAILSLASLKIYLQFDISLSQGNFIYFSLRFNHTVYQERSFTYSCNKYICGSLVCLMHFPGMWEEISGLATQQTGHSTYCSSFNFNRTRLTDSMQ